MQQVSSSIAINKKTIDDNFDEYIYAINVKEYEKRIEKEFNSVFSRFFNKEYKQVMTSINLCRKDVKKIKYKTGLRFMQALRELQESNVRFTEREMAIKGIIGKDYNGTKMDWTKLLEHLTILETSMNTNLNIETLVNIPYDIWQHYRRVFTQTSKSFDEAQDKAFSTLRF